jgi:hypothetical protein
MRARILPDGIISIRRYPLAPAKRLAQYARKLRRLVAPELDYWCFRRPHRLRRALLRPHLRDPGLPHEYPADKVVVLPPLVTPRPAGGGARVANARPWSSASRWSAPAS